MAKAQACIEAMRWCLHSNIKSITILTDCQGLIIQLKDDRKAEWNIRNILQDIKLMCKSFDHVCITKVSRLVVQDAQKQQKQPLGEDANFVINVLFMFIYICSFLFL